MLSVSGASANVDWPAPTSGGLLGAGVVFKEVSFDTKVYGDLPSVFIHQMFNTEVDGSYIGLQTDENGQPNKVVFTMFIGAHNFANGLYYVNADDPAFLHGLTCDADNRTPAESRGHISCITDFAWKLDTWYRLTIRMGDATRTSNGTKLFYWEAYLSELSDDGSEVVIEHLLTKIATPSRYIASARYASAEPFYNPSGKSMCNFVGSAWRGQILVSYPVYDRMTISGHPEGGVLNASCDDNTVYSEFEGKKVLFVHYDGNG